MLHFDPTRHRFSWHGVPIPSVTQVLRASNIIDTRFYRVEHCQRGSAVHELCEQLVLAPDRVDWAAINPNWLGYLDAAAEFLQDHRPSVQFLERRVVLPGRAAGIVDAFGAFIQQPTLHVLWDWKTGSYRWWHAAQLAAYTAMLRSLGLTVHQRAIVELRRNGRYHLKYLSAAEIAEGDAVWTAALTLLERRMHHDRDIRECVCGNAPDDALDSEPGVEDDGDSPPGGGIDDLRRPGIVAGDRPADYQP